MIGLICGKVIFSDGTEVIVQTTSGIGYQIYFKKILMEGSYTSLFISHVIREASQDLYGFVTLRDKKLFEMLTTVKGVGPKSSASLINNIGSDEVCRAIMTENKKILASAPGVGPKAAAQIILDLAGKIHKVQMFSNKFNRDVLQFSVAEISREINDGNVVCNSEEDCLISDGSIVDDTIMACKELGFSESQIVPIINRILSTSKLNSPEQLVHLVLKEV